MKITTIFVLSVNDTENIDKVTEFNKSLTLISDKNFSDSKITTIFVLSVNDTENIEILEQTLKYWNKH